MAQKIDVETQEKLIALRQQFDAEKEQVIEKLIEGVLSVEPKAHTNWDVRSKMSEA